MPTVNILFKCATENVHIGAFPLPGKIRQAQSVARQALLEPGEGGIEIVKGEGVKIRGLSKQEKDAGEILQSAFEQKSLDLTVTEESSDVDAGVTLVVTDNAMAADLA